VTKEFVGAVDEVNDQFVTRLNSYGTKVR
jgi:hypothetical protein